MSRWISGVGLVQAISYPGHVQNPAVRVTIDFAGHPLVLVFQSRVNLRAIDIGQQIKVAGNCVLHGEQRILYNPQYEIIDLVR